MTNLSLSIVLVGEIYLNKFKKYTVHSLRKNIEKINNKNLSITFFISTETKLKDDINLLIKKNFKKFHYELIYDYDLNGVSYDKISYSKISNIQKVHLNKAIIIKSKYLIFIYSDIIYSNNSFLYSFRLLENNNKISAVGSFALELNLNKKFNLFFQKLLNNKNYLQFFFLNFYDLISNFHQTFIYGNNLNSKSSFFFLKKKNVLFIKSQHYHPIVIRPNRIVNDKILSLDSSLFQFFNSTDEIYIEKNMHNLSIFSFNYTNVSRNKIYDINKIKLLDKKDIKKFNFLNLHFNIDKSKKNFQYFLDNYVFLSFSKNFRIKSLNNFFNVILQKKIIRIKNNVAIKYFSALDKIPKIEIKKIFLFFIIKNFTFNIFFRYMYARKVINLFYNTGVINPSKSNIKDSYFVFYYVLFMSYSSIYKIRYIIRLLLKNII
jgi:hypothetical protein